MKEKKYRVYVPSRSEFVEILEFRKAELERYVNDYQKVQKWGWPEEWGPIIWNGPIVRDGGDNKALREIVDTRLAIQFYQGKCTRTQKSTARSSLCFFVPMICSIGQ